MRLAGSLSEPLRLPHHRNSSYRRFLRWRRRGERDFDADCKSGIYVLLPKNLPVMLLQDTPTGAESQAGDGLIFSSFFFFPSFSRAAGGLGDVEDSEARLFFGGDDESALAALTDGIERVVHDLNADLQQLIGISLNDERIWRKLAAHFYVESLPLRLRELDGGAQQSLKIYGSHGG